MRSFSFANRKKPAANCFCNFLTNIPVLRHIIMIYTIMILISNTKFNMKKSFTLKTILLLALTIACLYSKAQNLEEDTTKHDTTKVKMKSPRLVYLELGGPGLALTVNYDARFNSKIQDKWGFHVGTGYYNTGANSVFSIPLQVNYLIGKKNSFLEFGAGTTFLYSQGRAGNVFDFDDVTGFIGTATIGYRFLERNGGINFRVEFTPIFSDEGITPGGGVSIGYTF